MTEFVQSLDRDAGEYVKIHVRSGLEVGRSVKPFPGVEEVDPMESEPLPPQGFADPLEMMR